MSVETATQEQIEAYLDRIGYKGPLDGSLDMLTALQERHLHTVPYENLDIIDGVPLSLEPNDLYHKIVVRKRGGYCFELNALFGWLLSSLHFEVTNLFARFWRDETELPPKRRHHVLKVTIQNVSYLVDVGVGGIVPRKPIKLEEGYEELQEDELYKIDKDDYFGWLLCEQKRGDWSRIYSFTDEPQLPKDYAMASYWCEHASDSIFTKLQIAAIRTKEGRYSLADREFRIFTADGVETFTPATDEEFHQALKFYFGIEKSIS